MSRRCTDCRRDLPAEQYYFISKASGKLRGQCKDCMRKRKLEQRDPSWTPACWRCGERLPERVGSGRRLCEACFSQTYDVEHRRQPLVHAERAHRAADRRPGADHLDQHLWLGPAHVRGAHGLRDGALVRAREHGPGRRGRRRRRQGQGRRLGRPAVQHRLRALQELRAAAHQLLPDRAAGAQLRRCRLRLRRHGSLGRWAGGAAARALV